MNILFLVNELNYTCGVTNHLLHLAGGLTKGNKIFIITGSGNGIGRFDKTDAEILVDKRFLHENRNSVNYLSAVNVLAKFIRKNKTDIVHSHSHYAANIAALASKVRQFPKIQTNHGLLAETGRLKHFTADKYVAINEHIYDYIINKQIAKPANVKFIRCGIKIPNKLPAKKGLPMKVIAASRFINQKGLDVYIEAVSKIPKSIRAKAEFYLAGEGEEEKALKKLNATHKSGIRFTGRIENLPDYFKNTHIFIYTSRSSSEGFPAVITEAGANNNLLITSGFTGADSVVKNSVDGFVFPVNDSESLAKLITNSISNYKELSAISEKFYYKVKDLFDLEKMITKHNELYEECLKA